MTFLKVAPKPDGAKLTIMFNGKVATGDHTLVMGLYGVTVRMNMPTVLTLMDCQEQTNLSMAETLWAQVGSVINVSEVPLKSEMPVTLRTSKFINQRRFTVEGCPENYDFTFTFIRDENGCFTVNVDAHTHYKVVTRSPMAVNVHSTIRYMTEEPWTFDDSILGETVFTPVAPEFHVYGETLHPKRMYSEGTDAHVGQGYYKVTKSYYTRDLIKAFSVANNDVEMDNDGELLTFRHSEDLDAFYAYLEAEGYITPLSVATCTYDADRPSISLI